MLNVRPFELQDKEAVLELISDIATNEFGLELDVSKETDLQTIIETYQLANGNFWIAEHDKNLVGTIALLNLGEQTADLRRMFVAKEYRGKTHGTAQKLLLTLLHWAKTKQYSTLYLETTAPLKAAQRFYEKHGFSDISKSELPKNFPISTFATRFFKLELA